LLCYSILIFIYCFFWRRTKVYQLPSSYSPTIKASVIIPARNESSNIRSCLQSLLGQDYPSALLEIIVVDDHSEDATAAIAGAFSENGVKVIRMGTPSGKSGDHGKGKKKAIEAGISKATGALILTTDADCVIPERWVSTMTAFHEEKKPLFIAAPVMFGNLRSVLDIFQTLDFLSLQGITAASVSNGFHGMSNGANLGYEKAVFDKVGGFKGIDQIASGDDMLLMQKIEASFPGRTMYCLAKEVIVITKPADSFGAFIQQRIRWASKARFYKEEKMLAVLMMVYLLNLSLLALMVQVVFFTQSLWVILLGLILLKTIVELAFLIPVARFFGKSVLLWAFLPAQPFHILYTVIAGFFGQVGSYSWKGRKLH
jgi:cellulose synthase/poly-beta-1,6-N-acetylglucosamine synthase-like glycosyltransferase